MSTPDLPSLVAADGSAGDTSLGAGLRDRLRRVLRVLRGTTHDRRPYDPASDAPLATADIPDDEREIERYWVNQPYAFVVITEHTDDGERSYYAIEPDLDPFEADLLDRVRGDIRAPLLSEDAASTDTEQGGERTADSGGPDPATGVGARETDSLTATTPAAVTGDDSETGTRAETTDSETDTWTETTDGEALRTELAALIERYGITITNRTFHALWYYLYRDFRGFGPLDPLLEDTHIEDISCDGPSTPVFIYHDTYADLRTNIAFEAASLDDFVVRLAQQAGHHISVGDPLIEATLSDGSRAELSLGEEVTPHGSAFTIRQYATDPFTPIDLIEHGTFDAAGLAYCWLCIEHNKSLLVAGGTAAGKTTTLNALSMFVPPGAKVVTIEDTRELTLAHENWLAAVTREQLTDGDDIDMYALLRSALRHRPEYLLVGEVRGEEAETLFQAMNTGHTTLSTIHADSIETAVTRLENEPIGLPRAMVESLDLLAVQTQRRHAGQRVRRAEVIAELRGVDDRTGDLDYAETVSWHPESDSFSRTHSEVLESIRAERGWHSAALRAELDSRRRFLESLQARGVSDYREFTTLLSGYETGAHTDCHESSDAAATAQSPAGSPPPTDESTTQERAADDHRSTGETAADRSTEQPSTTTTDRPSTR